MPKKIALAAVMYLLATGAVAAPVTQDQVMRAQGDMGQRINAAVSAYARKIGIENGYITYCVLELDRTESAASNTGIPPFGVNYYGIKDSDELSRVIRNREDYERSFEVLCLANAKIALRTAHP